MDDEDEGGMLQGQEEKVYYLFGRDIRTIPCFRSTMLTSLSSGLATTLGTFLYTSNGMKAARMGVLTLVGLTMPIWMFCAKKEFDDALMIHKTQQVIRERTQEQYVILDSLESIGADSYG